MLVAELWQSSRSFGTHKFCFITAQGLFASGSFDWKWSKTGNWSYWYICYVIYRRLGLSCTFSLDLGPKSVRSHEIVLYLQHLYIYVESREILQRSRKIICVYTTMSQIYVLKVICVCMYTHTHISQITKKSNEYSMLLHLFILDIAKLHNFSLGYIKRRTRKRKIFLSVTYYMEKNFRHSAIGCRYTTAKDICDKERIYLVFISVEVICFGTSCPKYVFLLPFRCLPFRG